MEIKTDIKSLEYARRVSKRKEVSKDLAQIEVLLQFATRAIKWTAERLSEQIFSDESWVFRCALARSYVTVPVNGNNKDALRDRLDPAKLCNKHGKISAWIFHVPYMMVGKKWPYSERGDGVK